MDLPKDAKQRRAILRRCLDGQAVVFAVQVHAFFGGRAEDFHTVAERMICDDLIALGYRPRVRSHRNSLLRTVWVHQEPNFWQPMPMPDLEEECDCEGHKLVVSGVMAHLHRHLDAYPDD